MCEKCQDRGFTEENHGVIRVLCDCEKAREVAELNGIPWRGDVVTNGPEQGYIDNIAEAKQKIEAQKKINEVINASASGIGQLDTPIGSSDTSEPQQPSKPKKKKGPRKRTK